MSTLSERNKWLLFSLFVLLVLLAATVTSAAFPDEAFRRAPAAPLGGTNTTSKVTIGDNGSFDFAWSSTSNGSGTFILNTATSGTPGFATISSPTGSVNADTYTYTELVPSGWKLTGLKCDDPWTPGGVAPVLDLDAATATFKVENGETVQCTFTNTKLGQIKVIKVANPVTPSPPGGGTNAELFAVDIAGPTSDSLQVSSDNSPQVSDWLELGSYAVTEQAKTGWSQKSIVCKDQNNNDEDPAAINLEAGDVVTCTITNDKWGKIEVTKRAVDPDTAANQALAFHYDISGTPGLDVSKAGGPQTLDVPPGEYDIAEVVPAGWTDPPSWHRCFDNGVGIDTIPAHVVVDPGETIRCYYDNVQKGKITIEKSAVGGDGDFGFSGDLGSFTLTTTGGTASQPFADLVPGDFTIEETALPDHWVFSGVSCTSLLGSSIDDSAKPKVKITLMPGDEVTCTYTNTKKPQIIIRKETLPDGSAQPFSFHHNFYWPTEDDFSLSDGGSETFWAEYWTPNADYWLDEAAVSGWVTPPEATCTITPAPGTTAVAAWTWDGAAVAPNHQLHILHPGPGEVIDCTVTNEKLGSIIINKKTLGGDGAFPFTWTGPMGSSGGNLATTNGEGSMSWMNVLVPGAYVFTEAAQTGWDLTSLYCDDGKSATPSSVAIDPTGANGTTVGTGGVATINVDPGETVTCEFTNTKRGTIIVRKLTEGGYGTLTFDLTGLPSKTVPTAAGDNPNNRSWTNVIPGPYTLAELAQQPGWDLASISCAEDKTADTTSTINPAKAGGSAAIGLQPGETVNCLFTNEAWARLIVDKVTAPSGDPTEFLFHANPNPWHSFYLKDADPVNSQQVPPHVTYTLNETVPAGWDIQSISSTSSGPIAGSTVGIDLDPITSANMVTIVPKPGAEITINYENVKRATIIVKKVTVPSPDATATEFLFSGNPGAGQPGSDYVSFWLKDGQSNTQVVPALPGYTYTVEETKPADGWETTVSCKVLDAGAGGSVVTPPTSSSKLTAIAPAAGAVIECTYTNYKYATIITKKVTVPSPDASATTFHFSGNPGTAYISFDLKDGESNTQEVPTLDGTAYTIEETTPLTGWDTTVACQELDPGAGGSVVTEPTAPGKLTSIKPAAGAVIECTYTNIKRATIIVKKATIPSPDASATVFHFSGNPGADYLSFDLKDGESNTQEVPALNGATYSVEETTPVAGWKTAMACKELDPGAGGSVITLPTPPSKLIEIQPAAGAVIECTYTNTKLGQIVVAKIVKPNNTANNAELFDVTIAGPTSDTLQVSSNNSWQTSDWLDLGIYSLTEAAKTGWHQMSIECTGSAGAEDPAAIDLEAGEVVKCVITNHQKGKIEVAKVVAPNSVDNNALEFEMTIAGPTPATLMVSSNNSWQSTDWLDLGTYALTEVAMPGWHQKSIECTDPLGAQEDPAAIVLDPGEVVRCVVTNEKLAKLTVVKVVAPDTNATKFDIVVAGPDAALPTTFNLGHNGSDSLLLLPGSDYSVTEAPLAGWYTTVDCGAGIDPADFELKPGDEVTCTVTNQLKPKIIIRKVAFPDTAPDKFNFKHIFGWPDVWPDFELANGESKEFLVHPTGTDYTLSEDQVAGWAKPDTTCTVQGAATWTWDADADPQLHILNPAPGDVIGCTVTNVKLGRIIIEKQSAGGTASFDFVGNTGPFPTGSFPMDTALANPQTATSRPIRPGAYKFTETALTGWDLASLSCDDGASLTPSTWAIDPVGATGTGGTVTVNLDPGETVKCTFVNNKRGTVKFVKKTDPSPDPTDPDQLFSLDLRDAANATIKTAELTNGQDTTFDPLPSDKKYGVAEWFPAGWFMVNPTGIQCVSANGDSVFEPMPTAPWTDINDSWGAQFFVLAPGDDVTCTVTNTKMGEIVIVKQTSPDTALDFNFTLTGGPSALNQSFSLGQGESHSSGFVKPGSGYVATETLPLPGYGWSLTPATVICDDQSPASNIDVAPNETVTCMFININTPPTNLKLSKLAVPENKPIGTLVGYLTAIDPGDIVSFALSPVDGTAKTAGNNFFQVVKSGSQWKLLTKIRFDYEKQRVHSIVVIATDSAGNVTKKQFRISILNVLDPK